MLSPESTLAHVPALLPATSRTRLVQARPEPAENPRGFHSHACMTLPHHNAKAEWTQLVQNRAPSSHGNRASLFTALLRLPNSLSREEKVQHVGRIIAELGLTRCQKSMV